MERSWSGWDRSSGVYGGVNGAQGLVEKPNPGDGRTGSEDLAGDSYI